MKIDHIVLNIDGRYQTDDIQIGKIRKAGFPYEPKWGKGTRGFKASNLWIGNEYLEMVHLLRKDGGGWKSDWVDLYNNGYRGCVCLMLETDDIESSYRSIRQKGVAISEPQPLCFKWFFNLLTRRMPWRNSYIDAFEGVPLQIGIQQMDDEKATSFMRQYMVPNSRDNGIMGISKVVVLAGFTQQDFNTIETVFDTKCSGDKIAISLDDNQEIIFQKSDQVSVEIYTQCENEQYQSGEVVIENCRVRNN